MKKLYLLFAVLFIAIFCPLNLQAQTTDVTSTYLTNADFETNPTGATTDNTIYDVTGWVETPTAGALNYNKLATVAYEAVTAPLGTVPANGSSVTTGNSTVLGVKVHWGPAELYISQTVNLPIGKYTMTWDSYLAQVVTSQASRCGYIIDGTATYDNLPTTINTWKNHSLTFTLTSAKAVTFRMGYNKTVNVGGPSSPILFVDNVKLLVWNDVDKTALSSLLATANTMVGNPQPVASTSTVYSDLANAITTAQAVYNNSGATLVEVAAQEGALTTAIAAVNSAITLQARISSWTTLPYNATEVIVNPSFETNGAAGWTNPGGFWSQSNTSFSFKAGNIYFEKWQSASSGGWTNLKISQIIKDLPNGIYKLTVAALNEPNTTGGAFVFANNEQVEVFTANDYNVLVTVTNNQLEIGYRVDNGGNYVAVDNFRLSYISDGSPYLLVSPTTLAFTPSSTPKTINVKGGNLTNDVVLTPTEQFSVSPTTLTAANVMSENGVDVTITSNATTELPNDSLILTSGTARSKVGLTVSETLTTSNAGYFFDQTIASPFTMTVTGDLYNNVVLSAPNGITLSETSITTTDALAGKAISVTWDGSTRVKDQKIYLTSGTKKDSVIVFAVNDNMISDWDGDNATTPPSKLTDFGWSQTLADGVSAGPASFGDYNTGGVRYMAMSTYVYTYGGKNWVGHRLAFLRTWGNPASNMFNLAVDLEANTTYVFRGVSGWHNNETNPTFTYSVNTAKSNTGDMLGTQSVECTVKQEGKDYGFEFTPTTTGTHYLTVSSSVKDDAMCAPMYLAIIPKVQTATAIDNSLLSDVQVYPTIANDVVNIDMANNSGTIKVYTVTGKLLVSKNATSNIERINLPSKGIFIVEVKTINASKTVKVVNVK